MIYTNHDALFSYLGTFDRVDVATWTIGKPFYRFRIRRLLFGKILPGATLPRCEFARQYANNHSKVYIAYRGRRAVAFVGSANLSDAQTEELVVRASMRDVVAIQRQFNRLWALGRQDLDFDASVDELIRREVIVNAARV